MLRDGYVGAQRCLQDLKNLDEPAELQRVHCNLGHCFSEDANVQFDDPSFVNAVRCVAFAASSATVELLVCCGLTSHRAQEVHFRLVHKALPAFRQALKFARRVATRREPRLRVVAQSGGARGEAAAQVRVVSVP